MYIDFILERFEKYYHQEALIWHDKITDYKCLLDRINYYIDYLRDNNVKCGTVAALDGDFSPNAVALLFALIETGSVVVPLTNSIKINKQEFFEVAQCELIISICDNDKIKLEKRIAGKKHELYKQLRVKNHPGLVLFSSGSTGKCKAAVHDLVMILDKFKSQKIGMRTIAFLLFDHIGGINTMFHVLAYGGCIVTISTRNPEEVLRKIETYKVELLPTSPTFINLLLLSESYKSYNLDSLKIVSYGTEPMPENTLKLFHSIFPKIKLIQTYGLSEVGILHTKSKKSDSLWVKVGGEGCETRIVDRILQIKTKSTMLGYLNADSPFTSDGWFNTGDEVEVDGEYLRILGRKSEIINVGGEKVYPAEVEGVIQSLSNVAEAIVYSEKNQIVGNIVCAKVRLKKPLDSKVFTAILKKYCRSKLPNYKIPVKVMIVEENQYNDRFKKVRPR